MSFKEFINQKSSFKPLPLKNSIEKRRADSNLRNFNFTNLTLLSESYDISKNESPNDTKVLDTTFEESS